MGGYAGHIKHVYEANTTASCIVDLFDNIFWGNKFFTEKLDGLAISAAFTSSGIRFARNKTQVKQGGMSAQDLIAFFNNHPAERTFLEGCSTIYAILLETKDILIKDKFYNFEIIDKTRCNIIKYNHSFVTLHHDFSSINDTTRLSRYVIASSPEYDMLDNLRAISCKHSPFPDLSQRWNYFNNEGQVFGGIISKSDKILYDCLKYDLLSDIKGDCLHNNVLNRVLDLTKCSYHHATIATQYIYNINSISGRELLKLDKSLKILSSREKSRVFLRDTFSLFHKKVQSLSSFILKMMPNAGIISTDSTLTTEGIVFPWDDSLYKLTGYYQELNQTQGKFKND